MSSPEPVVIPGSEVPEVEQDQHGLPRTLEMLLNDLIDNAYGDGRDAEANDDDGDAISEDTRDLRDEILERWPLLPEEQSGGAAAPDANAVILHIEPGWLNVTQTSGRNLVFAVNGSWSAVPDRVRTRIEFLARDAKEDAGGAAALRADVVALVLEEVAELRRHVRIIGEEYAPYSAAGMAKRLDRIEAAVREGEQR